MEQERYHTATLSNGLRIIHMESPSMVTYCGFAVNAGTRDEDAATPGMAHFIEHMLFKGTAKRKSWHILNRMENVGGNINAYTNKEETVIHCSFMREHLPRAVELLCDIAFRSTFPAHEISKEVEVIMDEIDSYEDSPADLIFDDFESLIFSRHPLGRNILGDKEHLQQYTTADALTFHGRTYCPDNMVFFIIGNHSFSHIVRLVEKHCSDVERRACMPQRNKPDDMHGCTQTLAKDTRQTHVVIGAPSFSGNDRLLVAANLLTNILGGPGMNSRLNVALREHSGLVYDVEACNTAYTDTGIFCVYFGCNKEDTDRCLDIVDKEFGKMRHGITPSQLHMAKKQFIGQAGVSSDNNESNALGMARTFLHYDRFVTFGEFCSKVESLTPEQFNDAANSILAPEMLSTLMYLP